ncbi:MAG: DUF2723 domain-containing protein [Planctomycetes bacterium]|nr:DUF2723 domain-containing protein [Planctomycetota bacterium]
MTEPAIRVSDEHELSPDDITLCRQGLWRKLDRLDHLAIVVTTALIAAVTIPRLPSGVCFGDSGGLQLAAATLGITHPPGYVGYASLGYLATLVPGVSPAYMVSLACWASGLVAILLCVMTQVRLGVATALACAIGLLLTGHARVWSNLLVPEVYLPTLALQASAAYLLIKYARLGRRRHLLAAVLLLGIALANRPPVALTLPFFVIAASIAQRRWATSRRDSAKTFALAAGFLLLPGVYALAYLWVRDAPDTPYNYLEQYNAEFGTLPNATAGTPAKLERIRWLVTGQQFRDKLGSGWSGVRSRLRWLRNNLLPNRPATLAIASVLVVFGGFVAYRRCPVSGWLLGGFAIGSIAFLCVYRVYGDAADFLPLLFSAGVFAGVAVSYLPGQNSLSGAGFSPAECSPACGDPRGLKPAARNIEAGNALEHFRKPGSAVPVPSPLAKGGKRGVSRHPDTEDSPEVRASWVGRVAPWLLLLAAGLFTIVDAPKRLDAGRSADATTFMDKLDLETFPPNALICSGWNRSTPLWYAQYVLGRRPDIKIINASPGHWRRMIESIPGHPAFTTSDPGNCPEYTVTPYRNTWRVDAAPPLHAD